MRRIILTLCALLSAACAMEYQPAYRFNHFMVVNKTGATIENLTWRVLDSGKSMSCDSVANSAGCGEIFPRRRYPQSGIEVNWTDSNGEAQSAATNPPVPITLYSSFSLRITVEIDPQGDLKTVYTQHLP